MHIRYLLYYAKLKSGRKKLANMLKSFDIEFWPFIEEIDAKEGVIRKYADAATMERIRGIILHLLFEYNSTNSKANIQTSRMSFRILPHN